MAEQVDGRKRQTDVSTDSSAHKKKRQIKSSPNDTEPFIRIDRQGNLLTNFLNNFLRQYNKIRGLRLSGLFKEFLQIMRTGLHRLRPAFDMQLKKVNELINKYKFKNSDTMETKKETPETEYRFKPEQVNWEALSALGLNKDRLEKLNLMDPLLKGYKTNELVPLTLTMGDAVARLDARLSLQFNDSGQVVMALHGIRKEPNLGYDFFGHEFSKQDKENLLNTGNMGRVVDLYNQKSGEYIPSIISVDRQTNELVALRAEFIKIPEEIKGVRLDENQRKTLEEGKPLFLEGMISKKGEPFSATLQYNADKRYVEFIFERKDNIQKQDAPKVDVDAPRTVRGKELSEAQYEKFSTGQPVYLTGLLDKQGKEYKGYFTFDKETGKTDFSFKDPQKISEKAQPSEEHKTQVDVNSQGKTNEATKNVKEPLKPGQNAPDAATQEQGPEKARSKSRKL